MLTAIMFTEMWDTNFVRTFNHSWSWDARLSFVFWWNKCGAKETERERAKRAAMLMEENEICWNHRLSFEIKNYYFLFFVLNKQFLVLFLFLLLLFIISSNNVSFQSLFTCVCVRFLRSSSQSFWRLSIFLLFK